MALTQRTDGSLAVNIISASWWNDYFKLFTGQMSDQPVTISANAILKSTLTTTPAGTSSMIINGGGSMSIGVYKYTYSFGTADGGESIAAPVLTVTATSGQQSSTINNLPVGPVGTVSRNIYRSKVNTTTPLYFLATVSDNTTNFNYDTAADSALTLTKVAPTHSTFGGALKFVDASGNTNLTITSDGSLIGSGGGTTLGTTTVNGTLSATSDMSTGGNLLISGGKIGKTGVGDIIDASGSVTYLKAPATINFQIPNGTNAATLSAGTLDLHGNQLLAGSIHAANGLNVDAGGINLASGTTITASNLAFVGTGINFSSSIQLNSGLLLQPGNTGTASSIQVGTAGFGVKNNSGVKLMEAKNNGTMVISGATYFTTAGSANTTTGGAFDGFDFAEVFKTDLAYDAGTVICPMDTTTPLSYVTDFSDRYLPVMTKCTHDKCNLAHIVSIIPAYCAGQPNFPGMWYDMYDPTQPLSHSVAMSGRCFAITYSNASARDYMCSDGNGGVRKMNSGESGYSLGVAFSPNVGGMIALSIRPTFVIAP